MKNPNFSKLLGRFEGDYQFKKFITRYDLSWDMFVYEIETNHGRCAIFEIDFISNFSEVKKEIKRTGSFSQFIEVKKPLEFRQAIPVRKAVKYTKPRVWEKIRLYANEKYGSYDIYFNFLVNGFKVKKKIEYDEYHPIYYRAETWNYILQKLGGDAAKNYNNNKPGKIAFTAGLLKEPGLLQDTVIDLDDGVDYLIDKRVANELASGGRLITLTRLFDKKQKEFSSKKIINAIKNGPTFDQITIKQV